MNETWPFVKLLAFFSRLVLTGSSMAGGTIALALALLAPAVHAYPGYQQRVPNGDELRMGEHKHCPDLAVPGGQQWCRGACETDASGGIEHAMINDAIANGLWWAKPEARSELENGCVWVPMLDEKEGDRDGLEARKKYNAQHREVSPSGRTRHTRAATSRAQKLPPRPREVGGRRHRSARRGEDEGPTTAR